MCSTWRRRNLTELTAKDFMPIKDMPKNLKIMLLKELGYDSDGTFVLDSKGEKLLDKYQTDKPIEIDNMAIFPKCTLILRNEPLSISSFLEEFGDVI
jgi:hypothetical protein